MSDSDSPTTSAVTPTQQPAAESGETNPEVEQTTASSPDKSSEPERVRGLMATVGRKETERQQAQQERDDAIAALADLQAAYDEAMASFEVEAPTAEQQQSVADDDDDEPDTRPPVLRERNGFAPTSPRSEPRPRMSEADAALREMEQAYNEHMGSLRH